MFKQHVFGGGRNCATKFNQMISATYGSLQIDLNNGLAESYLNSILEILRFMYRVDLFVKSRMLHIIQSLRFLPPNTKM